MQYGSSDILIHKLQFNVPLVTEAVVSEDEKFKLAFWIGFGISLDIDVLKAFAVEDIVTEPWVEFNTL